MTIGTRRGCFTAVLGWDLDEKGLAPTVRTPLVCREGVEERRAAETAALPASAEDSRLAVGAKHGLVVRSTNVDMVEVGVIVIFKEPG